MYVNKRFPLPPRIVNELELHENIGHVTNAFDEVTLRMGLFSMLRTYNTPWNPVYEQLLEGKWIEKKLCIIGIPTTGQVFGYILLGENSEIEYFEIHVSLRRRGLGSSVVQALKEYGYVEVNSPTDMVPFWEQRGFSRVHEDKRPKLNIVLLSWGDHEGGDWLLRTSGKLGTEILDVE